jgi:hypothetical protein
MSLKTVSALKQFAKAEQSNGIAHHNLYGFTLPGEIGKVEFESVLRREMITYLQVGDERETEAFAG